MRSEDNTDDITTKLLELFLENYEKEENILRSGSNMCLIVLIQHLCFSPC